MEGNGNSMSLIAIHGGPKQLDGHVVSSDLLSGDEVRVMVDTMERPPIRLLHDPSQLVKPIETRVRCAIYRLRDNESSIADWVGWQDEIPDHWPAMTQALGNASDDEILKLMGDLSKAGR